MTIKYDCSNKIAAVIQSNTFTRYQTLHVPQTNRQTDGQTNRRTDNQQI